MGAWLSGERRVCACSCLTGSQLDDATACRYLIRLENALKRFHHHYDAAEWEDLPFPELSASLEHVERIADIYECEQVRMSRHPPLPVPHDPLHPVSRSMYTCAPANIPRMLGSAACAAAHWAVLSRSRPLLREFA